MELQVTSKSKVDLEKLSDDEIVSLRIKIENEFKRRKIKFSTSEKGDALAIEFFNKTPGLDNLMRTSIGTKSVDALSRKGERYSIKTMKDGGKSSNFYLKGNIKKEKLFEFLLIVVLDQAYELKSLHRFSWTQFLKIKLWDSHMGSHYVSKSQKRLNQGECLYEK
jgi:hypothetical protein